MICVKCKNEKFVAVASARIRQEFRAEKFTVNSPAMKCSACGFISVAYEQLEDLRRSVADAYKARHDLLTSGEIRAARSKLMMSQSQFAAYLGVGEVSVKRWETWKIQERDSDDIIRDKCGISRPGADFNFPLKPRTSATVAKFDWLPKAVSHAGGAKRAPLSQPTGLNDELAVAA